MNKMILNNLIQTFSLKEIESHLIYSYLNVNKLEYSKNQILSTYLYEFKEISKLYLEVLILNITTIKQLENYLELLIPFDDRKFNGAFFTPTYIVDFIIKEVEPQEHHKNLDPSCGSGAFLIGLAQYYKNKFRKSVKNIVRENIFG
jgi:adenine-specific DNA-methyltransferase